MLAKKGKCAYEKSMAVKQKKLTGLSVVLARVLAGPIMIHSTAL